MMINEKKENITIIVSIIALLFSVHTHFSSMNLQEKYEILSTYGMTLNYQVDISNKEGQGNIIIDDIEINKGRIDIIPKVGGIEKVYAIHYYKNNVKAIVPVEPYSEQIKKHDAHSLSYRLDKYNIDIIAETSNSYFGTLFLVIKDYQNNYFTNMIVYEVPKEDMFNIKTRTYFDIDLLHVYNNDITVLPQFDAEQMKEYKILKTKIEEIL